MSGFSYENMVLRPAVLLALGAERDVIVHVAPVERLTASGARKRSVAELGKGTPDLLASIRWVRIGSDGLQVASGAQWLCFELKAPPCPDIGAEVTICSKCLSAKLCGCGARTKTIPRWSLGSVSKEQRDTHAAWERGGRWVHVVRDLERVREALATSRARLRAAGLEPCAVEGR